LQTVPVYLLAQFAVLRVADQNHGIVICLFFDAW